MKVRELQTALEQIRELYTSANARTPARDFDQLIEMFDGHENKTIEAFVEETRALLAASRTNRARAEAFDRQAVSQYAQELESAGADRQTFDDVMGKLRGDRRVNKRAVYEITSLYYGTVPKSYSRTQLLKKIENAFLERAQTENKKGVLDKLAPW